MRWFYLKHAEHDALAFLVSSKSNFPKIFLKDLGESELTKELRNDDIFPIWRCLLIIKAIAAVEKWNLKSLS